MIQFDKIINIAGWIICNLGVIYFLIRIIYFSAKTSLHVEIKEIIAFKYFLPIHLTEEDGEMEKKGWKPIERYWLEYVWKVYKIENKCTI